jgi:hypothetical protein
MKRRIRTAVLLAVTVAAGACGGCSGEKEKPKEKGPPSPLDAEGKLLLAWNVPQGLKAAVTRSGVLKLSGKKRVTLGSQERSFDEEWSISWKRKYQDTYKSVRDGQVRQIVRATEEDFITAYNPRTNRVEDQDLPTRDTTITMTVRSDGHVDPAVDTDPRCLDQLKELRLGTALPGRKVAVGERWQVPLSRLRATLSGVKSGWGRLKLDKVALDPDLNEYVAEISGTVNVTLEVMHKDYETVPVKCDAQVTIRYVPSCGLEILRKLDGKLRVNYTHRGDPADETLTGKGTLSDLTVTKIVER